MIDERENAFKKLHPDEPFFLIRARDVFSCSAIMAYGNISNRTAECHQVIEDFQKWQRANMDKLKKPD